jgi:hypothetical protein
MVDFADRHRLSSDSVDRVSSGNVYTSCVAFVFLVGPRLDLVVRSDYVVLGHSDHEDLHLAPVVGGSLVDAMGKAIKKTSQWLMADRC